MPSTRNRGRNCELLSAKLVEVGLLKRRDDSTRNKPKRLPCKKIKQELDEMLGLCYILSLGNSKFNFRNVWVSDE